MVTVSCYDLVAFLKRHLHPDDHGFLADALWKLGEREAAIQRICRAVQLEPGYQWAWDTLRRWSEELERPQLAEDEKILATPMVVKELPPPIRRIIGDLSNTDRVLLGLDLRPLNG